MRRQLANGVPGRWDEAYVFESDYIAIGSAAGFGCLSFDRRIGSAAIGHFTPTRYKGRANSDENPADSRTDVKSDDWYADCGPQQYIHSNPGFYVGAGFV